MISFIITSVNEDYEYLNETFAQIDKVCNDYEIVFASDREYTNDWVGNVNYIHTDLETSVKNYNEGIRQSKGDIVLVTADDHFILEDPTPIFKSKKSPLVGCRGFVQLDVDQSLPAPGGGPGPPWPKCDTPWLYPWVNYLVAPFPMFNRGVLEVTDGVIFNESFKHHWVDHWLGYFFTMKYGTSVTMDPGSFLKQREKEATNSSHDDHDMSIMRKLTDHFQKDPEMSYNTSV